MIYVHYNKQTGGDIGFYSVDFHGDNIPADCIKITDDVWLHFVNNQGKYKVDASKTFEDKEYDVFEDVFIEPLPDIDMLKNIKIQDLNNKCEDAICEGFTSSALGAPHKYRFNKDEDQMNFNQQATMLLLNPNDMSPINWKTEDEGILSHTRDQFLVVIKDASDHKEQCIGKYWQLKNSVNSCTTADEINAIQW